MAEKSDSEGFDAKQARYDHPSGWIQLTRYETVRLLVDALLEAPPGHRFNKSELQRRTGLSREIIREHLPFLVELGVVNEIDDGEWTKYELNDNGKVTQELFELNSAVNSVLDGEAKNIQDAIPITPPDTEPNTTRGSDPPESIDLIDNSSRSDEDDDLVSQPPSQVSNINAV